MRRKITERLLEWKRSARRTCLVLKGARQVGKTYILREFGRENYDSLVYFDLSRDETARRIFDGSLDADNLIMGLSTIVGESKLIPGRTLIFLDEIQDCPRARTSLKSFADDGRYDVVASGSLLGLRMNDVPDYPVGYEEIVEMHPMDFEEFMWALGTGTEAIEHIRGCIRDRKPIGQPILDIMTRYLRWYCIVGGMPAAVETFASERKFDNVHTIHSDILSSYMDDVSKHAPASQRTNVAGCFRSIAVQLAREGKRFMYSRVEPTEPSSAIWRRFRIVRGLQGLLVCPELAAGGGHIRPLLQRLPASDAAGGVHKRRDVQTLHDGHGPPAFTVLPRRQGRRVQRRHGRESRIDDREPHRPDADSPGLRAQVLPQGGGFRRRA